MESTIIQVPMSKTNTFLIKGKQGYLLIDTGVRGKSKSVQKALGQENATLKEISLIVITHVHYDHVGGLYALKSKSSAPVLIHEKAGKLLKQGYTKMPSGTGWFSKILSGIGSTFVSSRDQFKPVEPDILIEDDYDLSSFGIDGQVIHTPGHTADSICVILEDKYCFTGDTMFNILPHSVFPPFANDQVRLLESWEKIKKYNCEKYFPAHGKAFTDEKFEITFKKFISNKS
jgi:glyoxylase-like metal-dependent hydrolase (beta-lactamase superfamily II)